MILLGIYEVLIRKISETELLIKEAYQCWFKKISSGHCISFHIFSTTILADLFFLAWACGEVRKLHDFVDSFEFFSSKILNFWFAAWKVHLLAVSWGDLMSHDAFGSWRLRANVSCLSMMMMQFLVFRECFLCSGKLLWLINWVCRPLNLFLLKLTIKKLGGAFQPPWINWLIRLISPHLPY